MRIWRDVPERPTRRRRRATRSMQLWIEAEVLRLTNIRAGAEPQGRQSPAPRGR